MFSLLLITIIYLENPEQSSEQPKIVLNNGNLNTNRPDAIDDRASNWSAAPKFVIFYR